MGGFYIILYMHTKRSPTQSDIYQRLYLYNLFSWWWARSRSKNVENWNKYVEKNCASSWSFTKSRNELHGHQNIRGWICWRTDCVNENWWSQHVFQVLLSRKSITNLLFFFSWRYNPHWGVVFYRPLAGLSLLAYEVSWSHTTTHHSR